MLLRFILSYYQEHWSLPLTAIPRSVPSPRVQVIGLTAQTGRAQSRELRDLLWRRLKIWSAIWLFLSGAFNLRVFASPMIASKLAPVHSVILILCAVCPLISLLHLLAARKPTTRRLRAIELVLLLAALAGVGFWNVLFQSLGSMAPFPPMPAMQALVKDRIWTMFPDGSVYVDAGYRFLQVNTINWCVVAVGYAVLIPNTWRRCALMMALIVSVAVASVPLAALITPVLWLQARQNVIITFYMTTSFAALGLYGTHKLNVLRDEVRAAQQVGQYTLQRRLGSGGMGEVYLAQHRLLRRPCAVKLVRPDLADRADGLLRFEREVRAMARLTHPSIVEIYDYGQTDDGLFYYAMQYLPGLTLEDMVKEFGPLPPARAIHLLRQVCRGLHAAHRAGLIHRDIKPSNIHVCERGGEYDLVKLLDFGLVHVVGRPELSYPDGIAPVSSDNAVSGENVKLTRLGHILGTPAYMSPEQARGAEADARSDLYSVGVMAYYLLSGHTPFEGPTAAEICAAHISEPPPLLSQYTPGVPADLQDVILRCLRKDRRQRPADAQALERALAAVTCAHDWDATQAAAWWQAPERASVFDKSESKPDNRPGNKPDVKIDPYGHTVPGKKA